MTSKTRSEEKNWALFWILILAFTVRLVYVLEIGSHPLFNNPVVDSEAFLRAARQIAGGNILGNLTWQAPLYSYILAILLSINGSLLSVRIFQAGWSALLCWLLYRLLRRFTSKRNALLACFLFAIYGPLIYFDGEILATSLHTLLNIGTLLVLTEAYHRDRLYLFLLSGMLLGLSATARGTILLLLPFLMLWLVLKNGKVRLWRRALIRWTIIILGSSLPLCISMARNYMLSREIILISPGMGINLYIGNNERAWETMRIRPGAEWGLLAWEPVRHGFSSPGEQSGYFTSKALGFATKHPFDQLKLLIGKALQFVGGEEIIRNFDLYAMRKHSRLLSALLWKGAVKFPFGILFPLSLAGFWLSRRRWRHEFLLLGYMVSIMLSNIVFFPTARYRLPMVPVMLFYSAVFLVRLHEEIRRREYGRILTHLLVSFSLILILNLGISQKELGTGGEEEFHIGMMLERQGDLDGAASWFQAALREDPAYAEAHFFMGKIHWVKGDKNLAIESLKKAISLLPEFAEANTLLGHIYLSSGMKEEALSSYREALKVKPDMVQVRYNMALILMEMGDTDSAIRELDIVVRARPDNHLALFAIGRCLEQKGEDENALSYYKRAITVNPRDPRPYQHAGRLLLEMGRANEAERFLKKAVELDPSNEEARSILEKILR
ncbi:MAG: tetratricopeptide repeat protein [Candidatus Glassbacteria bacterium]